MPQDITVLLPGNFNVKLLSHSPIDGRVATLGMNTQEFSTETYKFSVFIGFAKKPKDKSPYARFIAVKGQSLTDDTLKEGVYIAGNPFDYGSPGSGRRPESLFLRYVDARKLHLVRECYKIIAGLFALISDLKILDGKGFEPLLKLGEVLDSAIGIEILRSMIHDPLHGPGRVSLQLAAIALQPRREVSTLLRVYKREHEAASIAGGFGAVPALGLPGTLTYGPEKMPLSAEWHLPNPKSRVELQSFIAEDWNTVFEIEPGLYLRQTAGVMGEGFTGPTSIQLELVRTQAKNLEYRHDIQMIEGRYFHVPYKPQIFGPGFYFDGTAIKDCLLEALADKLPTYDSLEQCTLSIQERG